MRFLSFFLLLLPLSILAADSTASATVNYTVDKPGQVVITAVFPNQSFYTSVSFAANPPSKISVDSIVASLQVGKVIFSAPLKRSGGLYSLTFSKIPGPSAPVCSLLVYSKGRLAYRGSSTLSIKDTKPLSPSIQLLPVP